MPGWPGTRSAPGPATDSTCTVIPLASMSASRACAEVGEFVAFGGLRPDEVGAGKAAAGDRVGGDAGDDAGDGVVFFQGDDAHVVCSRGVCG